jgi:hypothetical protein
VTEAPAAGGFLEHAWGELVAVARRLSREQIASEFAGLFQGVGKPEIFVYGSFYIAGRLNEKPLVALRHTLRELAITKSDDVSETEDHIASLCEVMRYLIAGDDVATANLATQRRFFDVPSAAVGGCVFRRPRSASAGRFLCRAGALRARLLRGRAASVRPARFLSNLPG